MFKSTLKKAKKVLKPIPQEAFERIIKDEILHAISFVTSSLVSGRILADKYFQGESKLPHETGRSGVIVTCVRDGVRSVLPSMARIFTQSDTVAEFNSDDEEDEQICEQMTLFVNSVYDRFGGYEALIQGCTDALKARVGVVKVTLEQKTISTHQKDLVLPPTELPSLEEDPNAQVTEVSEPFDGEDGAPVVQAVQTRQNIRKIWHLDTVPPENFIVNASATCLEDARLIGTVEIMRIYDAASMGLDPEELIAMRGSTDESAMSDYESGERATYYVNNNEPDADEKDPMSDDITIAEIWLRIDADGDGVAELRHIITGGSEYKILLDEPVNFVPLGIFKTDLQPHVFFPISLAEDLIQDQDAQTALLRSILDNAALTNNPQRAFNESMVNAEDMANSEIGAMIRTKGPGQIEELTTPFVAGQTLPVLQYLEEVSEKRSGISRMSQGLDPDALQSTTKIAANAAVMGADARMEMMARNAGETGIKSMFLASARIAMNELRGPQSLKTMTGYQEVLPDIWHDQIGVSVNVGLGNGRIDSKIMALTAVAAVQTQAIMTLGMANPVCGWEQFRNTQKQLLRLAGEKSINPYFPRVDPKVLQQLDQQQAEKAAQANQGTPAPDLVGAEKVKGEVKMKVSAAELQQKGQLKSAEIAQKGQQEAQQLKTTTESELLREMMADDRERDKQAGDYAVAAQKVQLDDATKRQVAIEQAQARPMPGANGKAKVQ
jgi:hypothetical protein